MTERPTVRDHMSPDLVSFAPDTSIHTAIETLLARRISGAPVLDATGTLVGILTKHDCMQVAFSTSYHQGWGGPVSGFMSTRVETVDAGQDIVTVAEMFLHIGPGAQKALFFAAPEHHTNGAVKLQIEALEDAHGFHHDRAARGIVGRPGAG